MLDSSQVLALGNHVSMLFVVVAHLKPHVHNLFPFSSHHIIKHFLPHLLMLLFFFFFLMQFLSSFLLSNSNTNKRWKLKNIFSMGFIALPVRKLHPPTIHGYADFLRDIHTT